MNDKNILMYILSCFIEYDTAELKHSIFFQVKNQKTKTAFKSKIFPNVFFLKWGKKKRSIPYWSCGTCQGDKITLESIPEKKGSLIIIK